MFTFLTPPLTASAQEAVRTLCGTGVGLFSALTFQSIRQEAWLILIFKFPSSADIPWLLEYRLRMRHWIIWAWMWLLMLSCFWNTCYSQNSALSRTKMRSHGRSRGAHWKCSEHVVGYSPDMLLGNNLTELFMTWLCGSHPAYGPRLRFPKSI